MPLLTATSTFGLGSDARVLLNSVTYTVSKLSTKNQIGQKVVLADTKTYKMQAKHKYSAHTQMK